MLANVYGQNQQSVTAYASMLSSNKKPYLIVLLLLIMSFCGFIALNVGSIKISPAEVINACFGGFGTHIGLPEISPEIKQVILALRMPRTMLAMIVGISLAVSGTVLQGLFRNPLADPSLIGVTSGGAVGAALMIVLGSTTLIFISSSLHNCAIIFSAMIGSIGSTFLIYRLAKVGGRIHVPTMLLCGIAVNAFAGAIIGVMIYIADLENLRDLTFWSMGSFARAPRLAIFIVSPILLIFLFLLFCQAKILNVLLLGEAEAGHLGIDTHKVGRRIIVLSGATVGLCVSLTGTIAFVGLIVPHLMRLLVGPNHCFLIPAAGLAGGTLLIIADLLSRSMLTGAEIPIGILTAFIGAPFFLFLLLSTKHHKLL